MVFERVITINFADGKTLEYISTGRYTNGYVLYKDLKTLIRQHTGKCHFDLYDEEGINQSDFEMVYSLVLTCIFKISKCVKCQVDAEYLTADGICHSCWGEKNTKVLSKDPPPVIRKFYIDSDCEYDCGQLLWYKVYYKHDGTQDYIKLAYEDERKDKTIRNDRLMVGGSSLMLPGNRLVLESEIPPEFIRYYREVWTDTVV